MSMPEEENIKKYMPSIKDLITIGSVIVAITAWGFSLKGSIDLQKQSIDALVLAQKEANETVKSLATRQNQYESTTDKDLVAMKKDIENLQRGRYSYAPQQQNDPVRVEARAQSQSSSERPQDSQTSSNSNNGNGNGNGNSNGVDPLDVITNVGKSIVPGG